MFALRLTSRIQETRTYLLFRQTLRTRRNLHPLQPDPNRTRAHKDDLVSLLAEVDDRLDDRRERRQKRLMRRLMHNRRRPYVHKLSQSAIRSLALPVPSLTYRA